MLGQTIARHFAEVFLSSVCSSVDSILYWLGKKILSFNSGSRLRLQLIADFASESSGTDQFRIWFITCHGSFITCQPPRFWRLRQRMLNRKSDRIEAEVFLAGKENIIAVKTAMKRLGNRSDKIKNLCKQGIYSTVHHTNRMISLCSLCIAIGPNCLEFLCNCKSDNIPRVASVV